MNEKDIIGAIRKHLKTSPRQRTGQVSESDAEVAEIAGRLLAFTIDDFSAEDMLSLDDPRALGRNLAAATISDLLAVGAVPEFMLHSLVTEPGMDSRMLAELSAGLQEALDEFGAALLGGDVGTGAEWRYTGCAVGSFRDDAGPISRRIPADRGRIIVTGQLGDANLAALAGTGPPPFECRLRESRLIAASEAACIDTSDGLAKALETVAELNPGVSIIIDIDTVPYALGVEAAAASHGVRPEAFLFASAGEYELLAFVPEAFASGGTPFTVIGSFERRPPGGIHYRVAGSETLIDHEAVPDPRGLGDLDAYRNEVIVLAERLFG